MISSSGRITETNIDISHGSHGMHFYLQPDVLTWFFDTLMTEILIFLKTTEKEKFTGELPCDRYYANLKPEVKRARSSIDHFSLWVKLRYHSQKRCDLVQLNSLSFFVMKLHQIRLNSTANKKELKEEHIIYSTNDIHQNICKCSIIVINVLFWR